MATKLNDLAVRISEFLKEEWKDIVPFDSPQLPRFPSLIFSDSFRQVIEGAAESTQTPIDAAGMTMLSVLSAASAKKFVLKPFKDGDWTERTNLYTLISMRSGERKSAIYNLLTAPLVKYQMKAQKDYFEQNQQLPEEQRKPPTYLTDDVTPEKLVGLMKENNEQMAMLSSEGGLFDNFNGRYSNVPSLDIYLKGFTGDYMTVHRIGRPSETLYEPILTIGVFVQPGLLQGLPARLVERGFLGRFLYASPQSIGVRKVIPTPMNQELMQFYLKKIELLMGFKPDEPICLHLDESAEKEWIKFAQNHEERLNGKDEFTHNSMRSWAERFPGQLLRILSLIHIAEYLETAESLSEIPREIPAETLNRLLQQSEYFVEHAKAAFGVMKSNERMDDAKYLLESVKSFGEPVIKKQDLWKKTKGRFATAYNLDSALNVLADHGYVRLIESPSPSGLGRKGVVIHLHPEINNATAKEPEGYVAVKEPKPKTRRTRATKAKQGV